MDNLTHSLVGAIMGQAGLKRKTGLAMPALVIGANLPDVDAACFFWLEGTEHLGFRRGITHGPPALVILPLILAGLLWGFDRWQAGRGKRPEKRLAVHFGWLYGLSFLGALSHPLLDWLNVYGVRFWEPFAPTWAYGDTLFIIDVWLWALLIVSVWWGYAREKAGGNQRPIARGAIAVMLAYIGLNGAITQHAEHSGHELAEYTYNFEPTEVVGSPVPFVFWQREILFRKEIDDADGGGAIFGSGHYSVETGAEYYTPSSRYGPIETLTFDTPQDPLRWHYLRRYSDREESVVRAIGQNNSQVAAFLFWSRMPEIYVENEMASVRVFWLYDQRFRDPRAVDRFSIRFDEEGNLLELPEQ